MTTRIAVDVGGTFTDLVFSDGESGEILFGKAPTQPAAVEVGVLNVLRQTISEESLGRSTYFLHGMTTALNALIERKGAVVGLLTTRGFRDTLELRRGERALMNDLRWRPATPLVPRHLRLEVSERMGATGSVVTPLAVEEIGQALTEFVANDVASIAVVFLNAYANPEHELIAEETLRRAGFAGDISVSHRLTGQFREYERTTTTVVDAYVRPKVSQYVARLEAELGSAGFGGHVLLAHSGGGLIPIEYAKERAFETIMSGSVAGAMAASAVCQSLDLDYAIAIDVGGTSFDCSLIVDGQPHVKPEGEVMGLPLQTPWVDVRSIGAGGGSIAYLDEAGALQVGPESAGAYPGPCCYMRGGTEPTVTDAAGVLGMLASGKLASGLSLDFERSGEALIPIAQRLDLTVDEAAQGVLKIITAHMAREIRSLTIEQGRDPRDADLITFGGAGPLFGCLLLAELGMERFVVPQYAGTLSAWGLLTQDVTRSLAATFVHPLDEDGIDGAKKVLKSLHAGLRSVRAGGQDPETFVAEAALDLRYQGQEYTLTIPFDLDEKDAAVNREALSSRFEDEYMRAYSHTLDRTIEIVNTRAKLRAKLPAAERSALSGSKLETVRQPRADGTQSLDAYSHRLGRRTEFSVVERASLAPGNVLAGPAIVCEPTTTTYVDLAFAVSVRPSGAMVVADQRHAQADAPRGDLAAVNLNRLSAVTEFDRVREAVSPRKGG